MPLGDMLDASARPTCTRRCTTSCCGYGARAGDRRGRRALPSLIAATALVPLLYVVGRDIYDRRAGFAAAALGAVAPFAVWYAQEARMYALFMVFALLACGCRCGSARRRALATGSATCWPPPRSSTRSTSGSCSSASRSSRSPSRVTRGALSAAARARVDRARSSLLLVPLAPFALDQFAGQRGRPAAASSSRRRPAARSSPAPRPAPTPH